MKKVVLSTFVILLMLSSCKKDCHPIKSNFDYLIAHPWIYNKYYIGYVDSSNLGTLNYLRGSSGNIINLDNQKSTYYANGTVDEIDQYGSHVYGTWKFGNNEQTLIIVQNSYGTFNTVVVQLDDKNYKWYYPAIDKTVRYGEFIPSN